MRAHHHLMLLSEIWGFRTLSPGGDSERTWGVPAAASTREARDGT